jgi:phosphoribosyl-AMP cyclohydrolase / phosphoribosyl-ATP pyrophosphohydrolase
MIATEKINFEKSGGLVPCIVQDAATRQVLMLGYMNRQALDQTLAEGKITFFSRTRQRLWTKGETSGNFLHLVDVLSDCDGDTLLFRARPEGPVCHTGSDTCFGEENELAGLAFLEKIIADRKKNPKAGSYTNELLNAGINKIAQKVGEESVELIIESKDDNRTLFLNEAADLMYHYLVLLSAKGCSLHDVVSILKQRHK